MHKKKLNKIINGEKETLRGDMVSPCDRENRDSDPENVLCIF